MTTAPTYNRLYNFTNFQTSNPATPLPANQVDAELSQIKVTLDALIANAAIIQRSDGPLANASVGLVQLDSTVPISFSPPNAWQVGNVYAIGNTTFLSQKLYVCLVANIATVGNTPANLAPTWALLADFSTITIPPGSLNTVSFANQSVTTAILADLNVTTAKIATAAITAALIGFSLNAVQHRLSFATATPVMTAPVATAASVFCTPYIGNLLPLWNGSIFVPTSSAEVSQTLADATKSPAAAVAGSVYDMFAWNDAGTVRCTRGPVWSSATARSAGTALTRTNGLLVNSVSITNGPGAGFGTYMGTIRTDAGGATVSWSNGGAASGGVLATLNVWNMHNRVNIAASVIDNGTAYTLSGGTVRQARASANNQVNFVSGLAEDGFAVNYTNVVTLINIASVNYIAGIGLDSTTANNVASGIATQVSTVTSCSTSAPVSGDVLPQLGSHFLAALEASSNASSSIDASASNTLSALFRM